MEDIAGDALGMDAHQDRLRRGDIAQDEGGVLVGVDVGTVGVEAELAKAAGDAGLRHPVHEPLALDPVADELVDGDYADAVPVGEALQLRHAHHRAVAVHQLADHGGGVDVGQLAEIDGGLRLACPYQNPTLSRSQGEHVARHDHVLRLGIGIDEDLDDLGPVVGGDASGDAVPGVGIHGDGEGGAELSAVLLLAHHHRNAQLIQPLPGHGHADDAGRVPEHEADRLGGDELSGYGQVTLVLAALVIDDDDKAAAAVLLDGLFDGN